MAKGKKDQKKQQQTGGKKAAPKVAAGIRGSDKKEKLVVKKGQSRKEARKSRHPRYVDCTITCGCGNVIQTRSTVAEINVEVCSNCHPFYSGKQRFMDTAGRVEKFQRKYNWKDGQVQEQEKKKKKKVRQAPTMQD